MEEGSELGGYRLVRRLGVGGAGTVWLAVDGAGTRVALKMLHPALAASPRERARLVREARTVNSVRSSRVAHVLDLEIDDAQPFLVSEFIAGPSLATRLKAQPLGEGELADLADSLRETLEAVHAAGIVHRDVKPSNVILGADGPVLIDFGIARGNEDDPLTGTGLVSGTAGFASPALLRGGAADADADWWAWAATLLQAATGRPPFGRGSTQAQLARVLHGSPDTDGLPPRLDALFRRFLASTAVDAVDPSLVCAALHDPGTWVIAEDATALLDADPAGAGVDVTGDWVGEAGTELLAPGPAAPHGGDGATERLGPGVTARIDLDPTAPGSTRALPVETEEPVWAGDSGGDWSGSGGDWPDAPVGGAAGSAPESWSGTAEGEGVPFGAPGFPPVITEGDVRRVLDTAGVPVLGPVLLGLLACLPVVVGPAGLVPLALGLALVAAVGAGRAWLDRRRQRRGVASASDRPLLVLASPWFLVRGVVLVAVGGVVGAVVGMLVWLVSTGAGGAGGAAALPMAGEMLVNLGDVLRTGGTWAALSGGAVDVGVPVTFLSLWAAVAMGLWTCWFLPTGADLRRGASVLVRRALAPVWSRVVLGLLAAAVGCATFAIVTGGAA